MRAAILFLPLALGGCVVSTVASTAVDVVTLPVKVAAAGVDAVTTSQAEADEKRGRAMREAEERYGKALRAWDRDCRRATAKGLACAPRPVFVPPN